MASYKARWRDADENFRKQIDYFLIEARLTRADIANFCGVCGKTVDNWYAHPSTLKKSRERQIAMLFETKGLRYDMTLGEGCGA